MYGSYLISMVYVRESNQDTILDRAVDDALHIMNKKDLSLDMAGGCDLRPSEWERTTELSW